MEMKYKNANRGKLLVAVLALAMVIAGTAVILTDSEVNAENLTTMPISGTLKAGTVDLAATDSGTYKYAAENPVTLTVNYDASENGAVMFKGANITIGENVTLVLNMTASSEYKGCHIFQDCNITINGGSVTLQQSANAQGQSWWNSSTAESDTNTLTITNGGKLILDGANGFSGIKADISGEGSSVDFRSTTSNKAAASFDDVTIKEGSALNVSNANVFVQFNSANTTINGSVNANSSEIKVAGGAEVTVNGNVIAAQLSGDGNVKVNSTGSFNARNAEGFNGTVSGDGKVDIAYQDVTLSGTLTSNVDGKASQRIIVTDDLTVANGVTITVRGQFIVNEGATVTFGTGSSIEIMNGATAVINGDVTIAAGTESKVTFQFNGSSMDINGSLTLEGAYAFASGEGVVNVSGVLTVEEQASATFTSANVAKGGEVIVYGIVTGNITNNGTITVNSEDSMSSEEELNVTMRNGSTLEVTNVVGTIKVTDAGMTFQNGADQSNAKTENTITLANVAGITVTETFEILVEDGERNGYCTMFITGNVADSTDSEAVTQKGAITLDGDKIEIAENMTIGSVDFTVTGKLTVNAEVTMIGTKDDCKYSVADSGSIDVNGKIVSGMAIEEETYINAARYTTVNPTQYIYTTLATAITDGAKNITVFGNITVDSDITIASDVTVTNNGKITIGQDATITIDAADRTSGKLTGGTIDVDGTLVAVNYNKSGLKSGTTIISDISKASGDSMTYTNVYKAMEDAADGDTVEITSSETVSLDRDLTVKSGVTLLIPAGKTVDVANDVTVTVDGTINTVAGTYTMQPATGEGVTPAKGAGKTIVNGVFKYNGTTDFTDQIVGAYYTLDGEYVITPVESAAANINDVNSDIGLYGAMTIGDVAFDYNGNSTITINANDSFTFGTITLKGVTFTATSAASVTGTVAMTSGSVILQNVYGFTVSDVAGYDSDNNVTYTATLGGEIKAFDNTDTTATETGTVSILGQVTSGASTDSMVEFTVPSGATLTLSAGTVDSMVIEGTVGTSASASGVKITTATVTGDLTGNVTVTKLFVGVYANDILNTGATGTVGDDVTLDTTKGVAYVAPGCTVGTNISTLEKKTEYYLYDALYVTAYAVGNEPISNIKADVGDAWFNAWVDEKGQALASDKSNVGGYPAVYADIRTGIYDVTITVDNGIGSVAIDGVVLEKTGSNVFIAKNLIAGQHTISYQLKSGYEGTPSITMDGSAISGTTFTLSGTEGLTADKNVQVAMSLTGTSPIDYSQAGTSTGGDDGLGIVEILLIILVVVVVILAIFVVLRMMRS